MTDREKEALEYFEFVIADRKRLKEENQSLKAQILRLETELEQAKS